MYNGRNQPIFKFTWFVLPIHTQSYLIYVSDYNFKLVEKIIDYAYTGHLVISVDNVQNLMSTASFFQIVSIYGGI